MPRLSRTPGPVLLAMAALVLVAACSRPSPPPPPTIPTEGVETHVDQKRGFAIEYPRSWLLTSDVRVRTAVFRSAIRVQLQRRGRTVEEARDAVDHLEFPFLATRRGIPDPAPLVTVVVDDANGLAFQLWSAIVSEQDSFTGSVVRSRVERTVDGRQGALVELDGTREDEGRSTLLLLTVRDGDRGWALHCQAARLDHEVARTDCRHILESFRLLAP